MNGTVAPEVATTVPEFDAGALVVVVEDPDPEAEGEMATTLDWPTAEVVAEAALLGAPGDPRFTGTPASAQMPSSTVVVSDQHR